MHLSDDAKALIKEEFAILAKEQDETLYKLKEARLELKAEVAERHSSHQKLIHELQIYAWSIRTLFVLLLGGSIYGVLKIQSYVDDRIALRLEKSDLVNLALAHGNANQWRQALVEFSSALSDYKAKTFTPNARYRSFLFHNLIWVIAQAEDRQENGSWVGEDEWNALNEDNDFKREFLTSDQWEHDEAFNHNMAFCTMKFDRTLNALKTAKNYLAKSLEASAPKIRKAPHLYALAMLAIIEEKDNSHALENLRQAEVFDPETYSISDFKTKYTSFTNSTEYRIWETIAASNGVNFAERFASLISDLK